ncbi:RecB family exonuclease [Aquabacterium sp. OR-4]|uniref:RecB family exonuclease n=1 Tax=Aquabacterium sp. OR-4 TaxID=2978127 RepID=UPI0028C98462|nr:PD-(D/E)XK nuclease family protein [Aquabacterium sp. OR-4]MDT7835001.1 PD-(D/E)XK nuclease family protein [Aquabacterium sp. OR-4]
MNAPERITPIAEAARVYTVRASSWGSLFDCSYAWEGTHLLGLRKPSGLRAQLGTAVHASTAVFDKARITGEQVSIDDAAGVFVKTLQEPERDVDYSQDDLSLRDAERIGLSLHTRYCAEMSPRFRFSAVESTLQPMDIDCGVSIIVRLTGSMDRARIALTDAGEVIPDIKTGARVISDGVAQVKGRSAQVGTYQLMRERETGRPTAGGQVIALQTTKAAEVRASHVFDAKRVMTGTDDKPGLIEIAAGMFRSGLFPPNPQSVLCSPRYCARWATCHFHE